MSNNLLFASSVVSYWYVLTDFTECTQRDKGRQKHGLTSDHFRICGTVVVNPPL